METKQSGKFITILLGALLAVAVAYTLYANSEHNQIQAALETEKAELKTQLDELIVNYDAKIAENTALTTKLEAARADIISYKDSLTKGNFTRERIFPTRTSARAPQGFPNFPQEITQEIPQGLWQEKGSPSKLRILARNLQKVAERRKRIRYVLSCA